MTTEESALLLEANRLNYRLRSAFFYRKLKEYKTLSFPLVIVDLFPVEHLYSWDERGSWGIGPDAFSYVDAHPDLHLIQVFCHPKLLREYPTLLAYYRNIASLSQKAVRYLTGIDVKGFENKENQKLLNETQALTLARLFNTHVSLIISKKTFEESRRNNGQVKTILIASCITAEVQACIQQDSTISRYFNLTEVLSNAERLSELMQYIFGILDA